MTAGIGSTAPVVPGELAELFEPSSNGTEDLANGARSMAGNSSKLSPSSTTSTIGEFAILVVSLVTLALGTGVVLDVVVVAANVGVFGLTVVVVVVVVVVGACVVVVVIVAVVVFPSAGFRSWKKPITLLRIWLILPPGLLVVRSSSGPKVLVAAVVVAASATNVEWLFYCLKLMLNRAKVSVLFSVLFHLAAWDREGAH